MLWIWLANEMLKAFQIQLVVSAQQHGGPGEPACIEGGEEEAGRAGKLVCSYVENVNNGYILAVKDNLHIGDHIRIHGTECVITEKNWLN